MDFAKYEEMKRKRDEEMRQSRRLEEEEEEKLQEKLRQQDRQRLRRLDEMSKVRNAFICLYCILYILCHHALCCI